MIDLIIGGMKMPICEVCGAELREGEVICPICRHKNDDLFFKQCPKCNAQIPAISLYCPKCGSNVKTIAAKATEPLKPKYPDPFLTFGRTTAVDTPSSGNDLTDVQPGWQTQQTAAQQPNWQAQQTAALKPNWQTQQTGREMPSWQVQSDVSEKPSWQVQSDAAQKPGWQVQSDATEKPGWQVQSDAAEKPSWQVQSDAAEKPNWQVQKTAAELPGWSSDSEEVVQPSLMSAPQVETAMENDFSSDAEQARWLEYLKANEITLNRILSERQVSTGPLKNPGDLKDKKKKIFGIFGKSKKE